MRKMLLGKSKLLIIIIILTALFSYLGVNGFVNPLKYEHINEYKPLNYLLENEIRYYDIKDIGYIIANCSNKDIDGNVTIMFKFYDDEKKMVIESNNIIMKGYNCIKVDKIASYFTIAESESVQFMGGDVAWIDIMSTITIILGILLLLFVQYCIILLKKRYAN